MLSRRTPLFMLRATLAAAFALHCAAAALPPALPTPWHGGLLNTGWTRKDGAPAGVYSIAQDGKGFLWFAARDGLYSFDGVRFVRNDAVYGQPLSSPVTLSVAAHGDTIWVGYQFGDISRFEPGKVHHYTGADAPPGSVAQLLRGGDGTMWAGTGKGVYWLENERWRHAGAAQGIPDVAGGRTLTLLADGGVLAYFDDGVYRLRPRSNGAAVRFDRIVDEAGVEGGEPQPDGRVLINSAAHGMQMLVPGSGALTPFKLNNGGLPMLGYYSDYRGGLWVNTGAAIQLLDGDARPLQQFSTAQGFTGRTFSANYSDREGNVWFATENGVDRVRQPRLTSLDLPEGVTDALRVTPGDDGLVWIGNEFTHGRFHVPTFGVTRAGERHMTTMVNVTCAYRAPDGVLWFADAASLRRTGGGTTAQWPLPAGLLKSEVQAMTLGPDGTLWLSIIGHGVYGFRDGAWRPGNGRADLAGATALSLFTDARGRIWFGYPNNHLAMLDGATLHRYDAASGLAIGNTLAFASDGNAVWLGGDRGLARFDGTRFVTLAETGRGAFRGVSGIVRRGDGELWLHDTDGLAHLAAPGIAAALARGLPAVSAERFDNLDGYQGMPAQIRPLPTLVQATDGRLWYASTSRVGWIDPVSIPRNPLPPMPTITALLTERQRYVPHDGLTLPRRTTALEIDFTAAALSMPERVRFRYRLAGQDTGWHDAGTRRQAFYTNLAPGAYTFEVAAANEDGVWSSAPARTAFRIEPAFTQTAWFKLACALAAAGALYALYRWRLARVQGQLRRHLEVRMVERERIARTLHDTFLQSVQGLVLRFDAIIARLPSGSAERAEMENVLDKAQAVMTEGRDRVTGLRAPVAAGGDLVRALDEAGREIAQAHGAAFTFAWHGAAWPLAPDVEEEVLVIAREALSNALRHGASTVGLTLDYDPAALRMTIEDNGPGIAPAILAAGGKPGHWGLTGMRERAALAGAALSIDSTAQGTTISLLLQKPSTNRTVDGKAVHAFNRH